MYSYSYDKETCLLKVDFFNTMTLDDFKNYLDEFRTLSFLPKSLKILYDLSDCELSLKPPEVKVISEISEQLNADFDRIYSAYIVNKPLETALTIIFSNAVKNPNFRRRVFSTEEAARSWLKQYENV
ncbi:MAG: STAS/SEC14 domain-containing protein [Calditrichae bacterium]|nr:STAS/SEC14 domain-containing protein [Calditrichota bacterium]MCB9057969.1 STAS/SEC14 domain-containing protein [Calditrichia bacterium]